MHLREQVAELVHDCWRDRMARDGWTLGPYDAIEQTHDALVPYRELSRRDKRELDIAIRAEEVLRTLAELVEYERGPDREFLLEDMHRGRRVLVDGRPGVIESWTANGDELAEVVVLLEGGARAAVDPLDRLLVRVGGGR